MHTDRRPVRTAGHDGDRRGRIVGEVLLALAFALVNLRVVLLLMPKVLVRSAEVAAGVVDHEPLWRVYQSRLLGPHLAGITASLTGTNPAVATALVFLPALFLAFMGVLWSTRRLQDATRPPLATLLLFQACLLLLLPGYWLYIWDLLALAMFTAFVGMTLLRPRRRWFVLLYAVAMLNHEMALFMAAWLALDPVMRHLAGRRGRGPSTPLERSSVLLGTALLVGGVVLAEGLRRVLMIRETQPGLQLPPEVVYGRSFHFTLFNNLASLRNCLADNMQNGFPVVVPLFLGLAVFVALRLLRQEPGRHGALAVVLLGMVASLLLFGLVYETRVLLPLVPFVALNGWAALAGPDAGGRPEAGSVRQKGPFA